MKKILVTGGHGLVGSAINADIKIGREFDLKSQIIHGNVDKPITPRLLDSPVVVDKIMFKNLSYVQKYPLIILTGYDQQLFDYEVAKIVNPAMMQLLFLLIYCNLWFFFKENSLEKKRGKNFHKKGTS